MKAKIEEVDERERRFKHFEPNLFPRPPIREEFSQADPMIEPPPNLGNSLISSTQYQQLAALRNVKRRNANPILNGSFKPIDDSAPDFDYDAQAEGPGARYNADSEQAMKPRALIANRERVQLDILEDFQSYDEILFKENMQNQMLNLGLASKSLKQTEINLLQSNRIDRKTILLNHM